MIQNKIFNDKVILILTWLLLHAYIILQRDPISFSIGDIIVGLNRGTMAVLVVYLLLPLILEKGRPFIFILLLTCCEFLFGLIEESLIEQVFFPGSRGSDGVSLEGIGRYSLESLPIVTAFVLAKLGWDYQTKHNQLNILAQDNLNNELLFLKNQIHPHVLFNTLNNIYSYSIEGSKHTSEMILKLSDLMRYMLYESSESSNKLTEELSYLKNYVELQKIPLEDRADISLNIDGNFKNVQIAPFILIAFVENCFKHSLDSQESGIQIKISVSLENNVLVLKTSNTYLTNEGKPNINRKHGGLGLLNVERRLKLIYGDKHKLKKNKTDKLYEVFLQIDLSAEANEMLDN